MCFTCCLICLHWRLSFRFVAPGILFVLLRRPFDIGDRIHVSPVDEDSNRDGSSTWFVEKVG